MMTRPRWVGEALGVGLLVWALLAGCTSSSQPTAPTPSAASTPTTSSSTQRHDVIPPPSTTSAPPPPQRVALTRYAHDVEGEGALWITFHTSVGAISCELFERRVPRLVDNFVGLARGLKPWRDPRTGETRRAPFFDGLAWLHRAGDGWVRSGDPSGDGLGGPGYVFEHDQDLGLRFDQPGRLAMLQRYTHGVGSQFIITLRAQPRFDGRYPILGQCHDMTQIRALASDANSAQRVPKIEHVHVERRK